jgi:uncharacterized protein YcnI
MTLIRSTTRTIAGAAAAAGVLLSFAGAASAHLEPDPASIPAGPPAPIAFNVEHGCDGSPTVELQIKLADGITDAEPVQKDGWTADVTDGVVTFSGGSLPADTEDHFDVTFTAPTTDGDLVFPSIQTCEVGQINWIQPTVEGQPEPDEPAPVVQVTGGSPAGATTVAPPTTATATTAAATTSPTTAAPDTTASATTEAATTLAPTATTDAGDGGGSNTGLVIGILAAAVVVLAGAGYALYRARSGGDGDDDGPTAGTPGAAGGPPTQTS